MGKIVAAIPGPSDLLQSVSSASRDPPWAARELPSVDTITLLARRQPLEQEARTKLLKLLGYAASEDFLDDVYELRTFDLYRDEHNFDEVKENCTFYGFPVFSNVIAILDNPGNEKMIYFITEGTLSRLERLLKEMGWFIRNFQELYGRKITESTFNVSKNLVEQSDWLGCASCYIHEFGRATRVYKETNRPRVGELFVLDVGDIEYEVVEPPTEDDIYSKYVGPESVTTIDVLPYPRGADTKGIMQIIF